MPIVLLRPNALRSSTGVTATNGSVVNSLADVGVDSTVVTYPAGFSTKVISVDFGTTTIGANGIVRSVTPIVRHNSAVNAIASIRLGSEAVPDQAYTLEALAGHGGAYANQQCVARTKQANDAIWSQAAINDVVVVVDSINTNGFNISELWLSVDVSPGPTVSTFSPVDVQRSNRPTLSWTYNHADGVTQESFRVKVFTAAQYGVANFDPNTAIPFLDSGTVISNAKRWVPTADLPNGAYRAFIYASDNGSQGRTNIVTASGPYVAFTISITPPATPSLSLLDDIANVNAQRREFFLTGRDNLLDYNSADFEESVGTWVAGTNCTVTRTTDQKSSGAGALQIVKGTAASADTVTNAYHPVAENASYTGLARVRSFSPTSNARLTLQFFNAANVSVGTIDGSVTSTNNTAFTALSVSTTAPTGAVSARLLVAFPSATTDTNYVDQAGIMPGANIATWSVGGMIANGRFRLQRSIDDGATWTVAKRLYTATSVIDLETLDYSDVNQQLAGGIFDYEAPRGVIVRYRLQVFGTVGGNVVSSEWSLTTTAAAMPAKDWWLKSLVNPTFNQRIYLNSENITWESEERQSVKYAMGRPNAIVLTDEVGGDIAMLELSMPTNAAWAAFDALRKRKEIMLLQSPYGDNKYVRFGARRSSTHMLAASGKRLQVLKIQVIEVDA